jgi:hypothetical protein
MCGCVVNFGTSATQKFVYQKTGQNLNNSEKTSFTIRRVKGSMITKTRKKIKPIQKSLEEMK